MGSPKRLGILVGGGPAPGINTVISAADEIERFRAVRRRVRLKADALHHRRLFALARMPLDGGARLLMASREGTFSYGPSLAADSSF